MCSGSEESLFFRLIDFVYHSSLGLRAIKKMRKSQPGIEYGIGWARSPRGITKTLDMSR